MPWQNDNKVCFLRMEGRLFGDVPMNLELRLSVEDSPNSAGVAIDMVRCAKLALERGQGGVLDGPAAYFCKHPPRQYTDDQAHQMTEAFIAGAPVSVTVERDARLNALKPSANAGSSDTALLLQPGHFLAITTHRTGAG